MFEVASWIYDQPFLVATFFMFLLVTSRSQAVYWLARGAADAARRAQTPTGWRGKVRLWLDSAAVDRGTRAVDRWGLVVIPLSYLTWGFQTIINAAAGVLRIPWLIYTLVALPGYAVWAILYAAIGTAALSAVHAAMDVNILFGVVTGLVIVLLAVLVARRSARRRASADLPPQQ